MIFVPAVNFTPAMRKRVDLLVLHSMESAEKPGTARAVAAWFAGPKAPQASAHYCIDSEDTVQCVRDEDIAWHAPGANHNGIGIEHAGRAAQTSAQWNDGFSMRTLLRSIDLCEVLCRRWGIPAVLVNPKGLKAGNRGLTTHAYVTEAFKRSTHTDPGPNFPLSWFVRSVAERLEVLNA